MDKLYRAIDANLNRAREGLRVCEDIARFMLDDTRLSARLKRLRQRISVAIKRMPVCYSDLLERRNSRGDVGKRYSGRELARRNSADIFIANIQRAKEALRGLEEFTKPIDRASSREFQKIRFLCYELEKKAVKKLALVCGAR